MQTLYPPMESSSENNNAQALLREHFESLKHLEGNERVAMATRTALAVEQEMARLQNGIAELEALLAAEEQEQQAESAGVEADAVPLEIPRMIAIVQDEEEEELT